MAFPTTGILDNFNRSNEGPPPSADWTDLVDGHKVVSNTCQVDTADTQVVSCWDTNTFGPNCEAYTTITVHYNFGQAVLLRGTTLVWATFDGYCVYADTDNDYIEIFRLDNGAFTQLGASVANTWANGDKLGGEAIGGTIKGYVDGGGGWGEKISRDDATYSSAGYIGLRSYIETSAGNATLDDFGGGTIAAGGLSIPIASYYQIQHNQ